MKVPKACIILIGVLFYNLSFAKEFHVSNSGSDSNDGTRANPFKTISMAVEYAYAGDTITVHEGIYREWVNPIRGGNSPEERILFRAAPEEHVVIKGSEVISNWERLKNGVWKVVIPDTFFKDYNPFKDSIHGDWFYNLGRIHHPGEVFINGKSLYEEEGIDLLFLSKDTQYENVLGSGYSWYCESDEHNTSIWANFQDLNPNRELTEISVRRTCFYPTEPGLNFITIRGFEISQAATQWAPPTSDQVGMIATNWNKGWIIEDNIIHDSRCSGITLGKDDGTVRYAYFESIFNALRNGWSKENIGSHIVRNNEIYNCEQAGICGSFGAAFSTIENNQIHHIWTKRQFDGSELAGVKFHGGIDVILINNRIYSCGIGIFLDWMTQGARISKNLLHDNDQQDLYFEVNHGPFLVDNNILLSEVGLINHSNGGAFVHNLFAGATKIWAEEFRYTPYHLPHSTEIAGVRHLYTGDSRFYNNIFVGIGINKGVNGVGINTYGLSTLNDSLQLPWGNTGKKKVDAPSFIGNNIYLNGALPYGEETGFIKIENHNPEISIVEEKECISLIISLPEEILSFRVPMVTTELLGKTKTSNATFENTDGSPLTINSDYYGLKYSKGNVLAGPFSKMSAGSTRIKIW